MPISIPRHYDIHAWTLAEARRARLAYVRGSGGTLIKRDDGSIRIFMMSLFAVHPRSR
jgi:hypothetical protein